MKSKITKNLFWEIIDCPRVMSASGPCSSIISLQNRCNFQVPEPWNGDIENAKILILGLNPALDVAELFPSYDLCSGAWNVMCAKGYKWTDPVVEKFFEDRYSACSTQCGLRYKYADVNADPVKILSKSCVYKTAKNPFWKTVIAYASAVTNNKCEIKDLVFSDCIHCKSSNGAGCGISVKNICMKNYFQRVISVFITSGATDSLFSSAGVHEPTGHSSLTPGKTILLVGKKSSTVLPILSSGLTVTSQTQIGNYYNKSNIRVPITEHVFSIGGYNIKIVDGLPLPSFANRGCRDVEINGIKIPNW